MEQHTAVGNVWTADSLNLAVISVLSLAHLRKVSQVYLVLEVIHTYSKEQKYLDYKCQNLKLS